MPDMRIGFIGTGLMGKPMARNLLKAGFPLTAYNRTRSRAEALTSDGAVVMDSPREVVERCRPIFEAMGKKLVYCGDHGQGQMVKLCNQITIASNLVAAAEAVAFAKKAGLDPMTMIEAVGAGAAGSWVVNVLGPKMASHDFAPGFMVKLQQKDMRLVMEAAHELGVSLPGAMLAHQLFRAVEADGNGDLGTQALVTALEKLANLSV